MDILFSEFRKKDVIDVGSGKKLGKVRDVTFVYPEGAILSIIVGGGMFGCGDDKTIAFSRVEKVGEDAILIGRDPCGDKPPHKPRPDRPCPDRPCPVPPHVPCAEGEGEALRFDSEDYE